VNNTETADDQGRGSEATDTGQNPFQPFLQLVSGSAAFSGSATVARTETSTTSGGPRTRGNQGPQDHETRLLASFGDNARTDTWESLQALPTLAESPLQASDLRAERHQQRQRPRANTPARDPAPSHADPQAEFTPPHPSRSRRQRRFSPASILRFVLLTISIALIAASLVLMSWSLLRQPDTYPNGQVNFDASAVTSMNP